MDTQTPTNFVGSEIFRLLMPGDVVQQYNELAEQLYNKRRIISVEQFLQVVHMPTQLLAFRVLDERIISTAQATLVPVYPNLQVLISNVITSVHQQRNGHGIAVMECLLAKAQKRWGKVQFVLTNNKNKGNAAFYTNNGWTEVDTTVYTYVED